MARAGQKASRAMRLWRLGILTGEGMSSRCAGAVSEDEGGAHAEGCPDSLQLDLPLRRLHSRSEESGAFPSPCCPLRVRGRAAQSLLLWPTRAEEAPVSWPDAKGTDATQPGSLKSSHASAESPLHQSHVKQHA